MTMIQLQNSFVLILARFLTSPWDVVQVRYENYQVTKSDRREIVAATYEMGGDSIAIGLPLAALDILAELFMQKPKGQAEPWSWLDFFMDSAGRYGFEYKYGVPPLIARQLEYS